MTSNNSNVNLQEIQDQLKWVTVTNESQRKQMNWKIMENPFVPIGCIATVAALTCGLWNFYKGNSAKQQLMMRYRVSSQGFTVIAMTVGLLLLNHKKNKSDP